MTLYRKTTFWPVSRHFLSNIQILFLVLMIGFLSFANSALASNASGEMATLLKGGVVVSEDKPASAEKDMTTVVAKIIIPKSPEQIWPIVTDPQELMREETKVKSIKTISKKGDTQDVAYTVNYSKLLPTFNYVLRLENKQPTLVRFHRISGSFKDFEGSWQLAPLDNGQKTLLTYTLSIDPGFFAPKFLLVQAIKSDLPDMMRNVKNAINKKMSSSKRR